ncbi:hypothetical protein [Methanolacinia petrolearia]|uniref:hypothetical protein n=1 Tax=Methanolacinia petrolearia TaxID=54120 RepID=UPI003BAC6301
MNDWNYTKKGAKGGFLYGISGIVYFYSLGILILNSQSYATSSQLMTWGLVLALIGMVLFFPLLIVPLPLSGFSTEPVLTGLLFIIIGVAIGAIVGNLWDFYLIQKNKKTKEKREETVNPEKGIYLLIYRGDKKPIIISEKFVNYCIIVGIILWAVLLAIDISDVTENYEVYGYYDKFPSGDTINFDKDSGTFIEKTSGGTKTGTYKENEDQTLLTLYYSDGETAEYYIENKAFRLVPANRSQYSSDEEVKDNLYLKPKVM